MTPEEKLTAMGLMLPNVPKTVGSYLPYKVSADTLYLSGQGPMRADGSFATGKVGRDVGVDEAYEHAKIERWRPASMALGHKPKLRQISLLEVQGLARQFPPRAVAQREGPCDVGALVVGGGGAQTHGQGLASLHGNG